jgi:4-amino-4-deoxy-L-arabinose transferase-like glycosyltransferase
MTATTETTDRGLELRTAVLIAGCLGGVKLLAHLLTTGTFGYGFFVDELYFLACAEHLDWGYVDMPPLLPALTAAVRSVLGDSLLAVRLLPALAGAGLVLMTALLAREIGGRRGALVLAGCCILAAPIYWAYYAYHSMNAFEPLLWTGCAWVLVRLQRDRRPRLWLLFGLLAGLGVLTKHTSALFATCVVIGVLMTRDRRQLASRWPWLGAAVTLALFLPNLLWMIGHGFPHLELLANISAHGRDVELAPIAFLTEQVLMLNPVAAPVWLAGLATLLWGEAGRHRALAIGWIVFMLFMILVGGRPYYPAPYYPLLFAFGSVAVERWFARRTLRWPMPASTAAVAVSGLALAPMFLPCLPPQALIRYGQLTGIQQPRIENHELGPLPQLFADRFGWPEMAAEVARVYHTLPAEDRQLAAIFGQNYGQAGAIDLYGPQLGLPKALSGHLTYWHWGPRGATGEVVIVLDDERENLERYFESVELAGRVEHPYSMPYEHFDVWICRGLKVPMSELWPMVKNYG